MVAKHKSELINKLLAEMKVRKIKTPALSQATGIPKDRIYKWFKEGTSPKSDDEKTLKSWLEMEESPKINAQKIISTSPSADFLAGQLSIKDDVIEQIEARRQDAVQRADKAESLGDRLLSIIEGKLGELLINSNQAKTEGNTLVAYQQMWVEYLAEQSSGGDPKKKMAHMGQMGNILNEKLNAVNEVDKIELHTQRRAKH